MLASSWWRADRSWLDATEIYGHVTDVSGSRAMIDAALTDPVLGAYPQGR